MGIYNSAITGKEKKQMAIQNVFNRIELKYLLNAEEKEKLLELMEDKMVPDEHGEATIRNIYYDTDTFLLIRRSIEKPKYKEKLRVRSYTKTKDEDKIFVELKKKCKNVVFKRRIFIPQRDAISFLAGNDLPADEFDRADAKPADKQIAREITYFRDMYETLKPVVYLSYDREAFFGKDDKGFRITFDRNIMYRTDRLSLSEDPGGLKLIGDDQSLMEVKLGGGMPLWLAGFLSDKHIFKASFSKYGAAYKDMVKRGEVNVSDI